jgi:hypothetical protein
MQRAMRVARRVFIIVAIFYTVMAVLGLAGAMLNGQAVSFGWPLVALVVFLIAYGVFAWFAEPLYWASERRKKRR